MQKTNEDQKKQLAIMLAKGLINALSQDIYPSQSMEAVFGTKMEIINSPNVETMTIGGIVYNVWMGLFKNQMINQQWLEQTLSNGELPEQFEKAVCQLMKKASEYKVYAGEYMPELIRRGFDKIIWDKNVHNLVKLKTTTNTQKKPQNVSINPNSVMGLRVQGDKLKPELIQIDSSFEKCPLAHAAGIPLYVKRLLNIERKVSNNYIIVRMMSQPSVGLAPPDWQYRGSLSPAPVVLVARSDSIQFNIDDWYVLDDFQIAMLDDGPRKVTRQNFVQFVRSSYSDNTSNIALGALYQKGMQYRVNGLLQKAELNEKIGICNGNYEKQRVGMQFKDVQGTYAIRPKNLQKA